MAAAAAVAAAVLPAGAQAGNLIVPHASEPHKVEPHSVQSAPAPAPAPAPHSAAPAPSPSPAPSGAPSQSSTTAPSFDTVPEDERPGADIPPGERDPAYPTDLPDYGDGACVGNCLQRWHDWYFHRIQTVRDEDDDAAGLLREELKTIDAAIRAEGGRPAAGDSDGPEDWPASPGGTVGAGSGSQPGTGSQPDGGPQSGTSDVPTGSVEVIFGPVEPDLGPVDLGTWDLSGVATFGDMMGGWIVRLMDQAVNGTTTCPKGGPDDEVPICPN